MKNDPQVLQSWAKQALEWRAVMDARWLQLILQLLLRGYSEPQAVTYLRMLAAGERP
jgi:hypothetical protein